MRGEASAVARHHHWLVERELDLAAARVRERHDVGRRLTHQLAQVDRLGDRGRTGLVARYSAETVS